MAELKKEKQGLLKQERSLKEELASEVDNKESLDEKVTEYVKEKIEKDTTLEKTFKVAKVVPFVNQFRTWNQ